MAVVGVPGWLLNAGDAYFCLGQVDPAAGRRPPAVAAFEAIVQTERRPRLDNQRRLRALVSEHGARVRVFSAHDADELHRLGSAAPCP